MICFSFPLDLELGGLEVRWVSIQCKKQPVLRHIAKQALCRPELPNQCRNTCFALVAYYYCRSDPRGNPRCGSGLHASSLGLPPLLSCLPRLEKDPPGVPHSEGLPGGAGEVQMNFALEAIVPMPAESGQTTREVWGEHDSSGQVGIIHRTKKNARNSGSL